MFYMANCEQGGFFFSKMLSERALLFGRPEYLPFALLARKTLLTHKNLKFFLMPFTSPKMFCAGPNFLSQHKNLTAFSSSSKTFVPAQKHFGTCKRTRHKGQLISKRLFGIVNSSKKINENIRLNYYDTSGCFVFVRFGRT